MNSMRIKRKSEVKRMILLINNDTEFIINKELDEILEKIILTVLDMENMSKDVEISLSIVTDEQIKELNHQYREKDRPTDVLSFPMIDFNEEEINFEEVKNPDTGNLMLGDIIISCEQAVRQADEYGHSLKREVGFLVAHSMLHLLGYDHMTEDDEKVMIAKQNEIMDRVNLKR